jgi:hypothetical protein
VALVALCLVGSPAEGRWTGPTSKWKEPTARKYRGPDTDRWTAVASPDGRHLATIGRGGAVYLDGRPAGCGVERVYGRPVWRRDGRAFALLQRAPRGVKLCVVLTDASAVEPLTYWLPYQRSGLRTLFWVGHRRIGIGQRAPVPQIVFSWTDGLR